MSGSTPTSASGATAEMRLRNRIRIAGLALTAVLGFAAVAPTTAGEAVPVPAFSLPAIANAEGTMDRSVLLGKVSYVDFWASWCGPCRISLPAIDAIHRELAGRGFQAIAISVDVVAEDATDFLKRYPVSYPVLLDASGDVGKAFAVNGMPSGYLVDPEGNVRAVHVGFRKGDDVALREEILALLAEAN